MSVALLVGATQALAQTDPAGAHFATCLRRLRATHFAEAVAACEASIAIRESPEALFNLAIALRGTGSNRRAIAIFERFQRAATAPVYAATVHESERHLRELHASLVHVRVEITGGPDEVLVDAEAVARGNLSAEIVLDPGRHVFEARRRGHEPVRVERRFTPGSEATLRMDASERALPSTLVVETEDDRARIEVDGAVIGSGRATSTLPPGEHTVVVAFAEGPSQRRVVSTTAGARHVITMSRSTSRAVTARWWFWTAVGLAVAGATIGTYFALQPGPELFQGNWGHVENAITIR